VYRKCLEEVQSICCATLFSPVSRQEAVQAMGALRPSPLPLAVVSLDDLFPVCSNCVWMVG
jgi:hypothetical protein